MKVSIGFIKPAMWQSQFPFDESRQWYSHSVFQLRDYSSSGHPNCYRQAIILQIAPATEYDESMRDQYRTVRVLDLILEQ